MSTMRIGDGKDWRFLNGDWIDGENGLLSVPEDMVFTDGDGMQSMHWAFNRGLCYQDCTVRFEINLSGHGDTGIILRATDPAHFYLLHFPNCAQACRAQHFWAALSLMDDSGYLRHVKLEMVRRVPSQTGIWIPVEATIRGRSFVVRVGDYGRFEVEDGTYSNPGCMGLYSLMQAQIRNVVIEGHKELLSPWQEETQQPVNWFHPISTSEKVWQQPYDLKRLQNGELLLLVGIQGNKEAYAAAPSVPHLSRSVDGGRTWSKPELLNIAGTRSVWGSARINMTPSGRLIAILQGEDGKLISESTDGGHTWSESVGINLDMKPQISPQGYLNLDDGGILAFMLIEHRLKDPSMNMWTWGSRHIQAFACRSDDDGFTWSDPVNMDTPGFDADGSTFEGNLDLTEPCAVQLADGRVMAFIRPMYSPWMWETWSDDGGRKWGPCVRGPFPGYAAPNMLRTSSGAILIAHRLPGLNVNCSMDGGVTWNHGVTIDSGIWAMGSMVEVEPDLVLYVYWDTFQSLMRAQFIRVTSSGLVPVRR